MEEKDNIENIQKDQASLKSKEQKKQALITFVFIGVLVIVSLLVLKAFLDKSYDKAYTLADEKCRQQGFVGVAEFEKGKAKNEYLFVCEKASADFIMNGSWSGGMIYNENNFTGE